MSRWGAKPRRSGRSGRRKKGRGTDLYDEIEMELLGLSLGLAKLGAAVRHFMSARFHPSAYGRPEQGRPEP